MFCERHRDGIERPAEQYFKRWNAKQPERGGCRKGEGAKTPSERKDDLVKLRERWAKLQNRHLEKHGHQDRVDHRSLKAQGLERMPGIHLGPNVAAMVQRGQVTRVGEIWRQRETDRQDIAAIPQLELANLAKSQLQILKATARLQDKAQQDLQPFTPPQQKITHQIAQTLRDRLLETLRSDHTPSRETRTGPPAQPMPAEPSAPTAPPVDLAQLSQQLDKEQKALAKQRRQRLYKTAGRTEKRHERRLRVLERIKRLEPEKPTGMLARFKQEAYKQAHETWQKALQRAQRFVEQAKALSRRVIDAAEESPASAWAKTRLVKRDPEQMQRVDQYRQAELAQRLVKIRQDMDAKKTRSQDQGWSR